MTLVVAATPIGNRADASPRLATELAAADVIAAEDTRRVRRLLTDLEIQPSGRMVSYFEGNEQQRTPQLLEALEAGSGSFSSPTPACPASPTPGTGSSRPPWPAGVEVTAVPGPSAVLTALGVSALPVDRFCFEGFLPRKAAERAKRLADLRTEPRTMVFFEAPHRTAATLDAMAEAFTPDRPAAVCRELTKTHEEVRRGQPRGAR